MHCEDLLCRINGRPDVLATKVFGDEERFVKDVNIAALIDPPDEVDLPCCNREFGGWRKIKMFREAADGETLGMVFPKLFLLVGLIGIVLLAEVL